MGGRADRTNGARGLNETEDLTRNCIIGSNKILRGRRCVLFHTLNTKELCLSGLSHWN